MILGIEERRLIGKNKRLSELLLITGLIIFILGISTYLLLLYGSFLMKAYSKEFMILDMIADFYNVRLLNLVILFFLSGICLGFFFGTWRFRKILE